MTPKQAAMRIRQIEERIFGRDYVNARDEENASETAEKKEKKAEEPKEEVQ